jgi:putative DNA primase/helicase
MTSLLEAALGYAALGWPVFPCHPTTKRPLTPKGTDAEGKADGSGGLKLASTDPAKITAWWAQFPKALIGLRTGESIGAFVVDFDAGVDEETGEIFEAEQLIDNLERAIEAKLPETWCVATPRGGRHLYFQLPPGAPLIGNRGELLGKGSRIDVRGTGGYVCLPPSARPDGKAYAWLTPPKIKGELPAKAPQALIDCTLRQGKFEPADRSVSAGEAARDRAASVAGDDARARAIRSYALAALDRQARSVKQAVEGGRNNALNNAALALGHLVGAGALSEHVVRAELEDAAHACGLVKSDGIKSVRDTVSSGLKKGISQPADMSKIGTGAGRRAAETRETPRRGSPAGSGRGGGRDRGGAPPVKSKSALDRECAFFPLTDMGNAERFVARNKGKFLWCPVIGWLAWNGKRFVRTGAGGLVEAAVFATIRAIQDEANAVAGTKDDFVVDEDEDVRWSDKLRAWGRQSEANSHFTCIARGDKPGIAGAFLAVEHSELDADPWLLNVNNGTLVFRRGMEPSIVFRPHDPADKITKISPVDYDPAATCPTYDAFFSYAQPDPQMRRFFHQWAGYSLTGDASEQKMLFWYGEGKNGKSTTLELWAYVAGDYATATKIATFLDPGKMQNAAQATPHLAKLRGIRMLRTSEPPPRGARLDEGLIKLVTGGDAIDARHMYFTFVPEFKVNMAGNHRPAIAGADEGIWRRFRLAPWLVTVPEDRRDKRLPEKLRAEASGVLNRLLDGLRDWMEKGLTEPDAVTEATARYRSESDPLSRFLELCVRRAPGKRINTTDLYLVFLAWAKASGEREWSHKGFSQAMHERGYISMQSNLMFWVDVELIKSAADFKGVEPDPLPADAEDIAI